MEELSLAGNPLLSTPPQLSLSSTAATATGAAADNVRLQLLTLLPRLQLLDGKPLRLRPLALPAASSSSSSSVCSPIGAATSTSYSAAFAALTHTSGTATSQPFSSSTSFSFLPPGKEAESEKESLDDVDQTISERIRGRRKSALPWRNPPHPLPRPWKGKQLFTTSFEETDPLRSPINKNYRIETAPTSPSPPRVAVKSAPSDGAGLFATPTPIALPAPPETDIQPMRPEEDAPPTGSWLCPSLNNSMALLREAETSWDPTVWQIPREVVLQEEEQERRKRRSASPSARPTRASILRANYVADSLNPPPPPPAGRRRRSPSPAALSVRSRLRGDRKSKGDLLVLQADETVPEEEVEEAEAGNPSDSLEASDVDVTIARCPQGRLSAYGLLSRLREKIDDRFRAPQLAEDDGREVNKHFAYLYSLPIETDPSPALPPRSSSRPHTESGGYDNNDLAAQREIVQEMLQKELSYEAKQLLLSQQLRAQLEQNQMMAATVGVNLGEADAGGGSRTVALDYYEGGESESIATSASAATTRYRYSYGPSAGPNKATGGEGSDEAVPRTNAASTDYSLPDSARLFNEMEALRAKQMQSLLSLRAAGVQLRVEEEAPIIPPPPLTPELVTPLHPRPSFTASSILSPLQALALESVTPTVLSASTWNVSPDHHHPAITGGSSTHSSQPNGSSSPPRERALPTGAVDDGIQQLAMAMEDMKRRQQQSLNMLRSFSIS